MSTITSTPRFVRPILLAIATAALGLLAWMCLSSDVPAPAAELPLSSSGPTHAASTAAGGPCERDSAQQLLGWFGAPVGSRFRYRISDHSEFSITNPNTGPQPAGVLHAEAIAQATVVARRAGEVLVEYRFENLLFKDERGRVLSSDAIQIGLQAAADTPVLARLSDRGAVLGYGFADGLDGDQHNFLRGVLAVLTFQAPGDDATTWTCDEADTTGEYSARYDVLPTVEAGAVTVRRTRLHYTSMGQRELPPHELRGAGEATFAAQLGWLRAAKLDEGMTITMPLLDLQTIAQRNATATLVSAEQVAVAAEAAAWDRATAPATGRLEQVGRYAAESERHHWQQILQGVTLDQLLADLAALLARQPADEEATNEAFQKLQWLVKLDAKAAAAIGARVAARELTGDLAGTALSSLGAAGTPAAQTVLAAVRADRSLDLAVREHATVATLQLAEPSAELVDGLVRDAGADFDGRDNAMLVLGALAPRSRGTSSDGRTPLQALLAMETDAEARGELATWLLAIGNAAPPETMAIVQRHLGDADAAVRAAALVALRRVATADATNLLIERGLTDPTATVRREALLELGRREGPAIRTAIEQVAANDADAELRGKASEMLRARA